MPHIVMPSALKQDDASTYAARKRRAQVSNRLSDTVMFEAVYSNGGGERYCAPFVVGQEVVKARRQRLTGADKYQRGYFDVIVKAALYSLLPAGHKNVILFVLHPPDAVPYLDDLINLCGGQHTIKTLADDTVSWSVRHVVAIDEPMGGLVRALTSHYAAYNKYELDPGDTVMVCDVGGKISSMTPTILTAKDTQGHFGVHTLWDQGVVFERGIQDVARSMQNQLRSLYPEVFKKQISEEIIQEALRTFGSTTVASKEMDVRNATINATAEIINAIEDVFREEMRAGQDIRHVFLTGGGGGLLEKALQSEVFTSHNVSLAESLPFIHLANARGAEYIARQWAANNRQRMPKLFNYKVPPVIMILDGGNTNIKAILSDG